MELIKCEKLEKSTCEIQFSVDAESFKAAIDKAFKRESKKYQVPGFRKGKAPRHLIEKMYGEDVFHYDAINDLFPENYEAAVKAAGIEVVGQPEVDIVSKSLTDGVVLKAVVPVKPEVTLGEYKGLKAVKTIRKVEDSEVEAELSRMQERNGRTITKEEAAQIGDTAVIDFDGYIDGTAFEGGKGENYSLELGSGQFIPGFEDQVAGHKAGDEFDVNVTFPEDYQAKEIAGKAAVFKVKLHEVQTKELPELDDEFAKDVSEFDTLDELKASIRKNAEERAASTAAMDAENALVDKLVEGMQAEIPQAMIDSAVDESVQDFEYRLAQQGLKLQDYIKYMGVSMEDFRGNFTENAEKRVKIRLALEAVAKQENIQATDEEYEAKISEMAEQYKMDADKIKAIVNADELKLDIVRGKAIDFIKENAEITEETAEEAKAE